MGAKELADFRPISLIGNVQDHLQNTHRENQNGYAQTGGPQTVGPYKRETNNGCHSYGK